MNEDTYGKDIRERNEGKLVYRGQWILGQVYKGEFLKM